MIRATRKPNLLTQKKLIARQVSKLREEIEDLMDYLDLIEARAENAGKSRYATAEVSKRVGLD